MAGYGINGNLTPINHRTKSEQREIAKKGGIASGKSRREKKVIESTLQKILDMAPSTDEEMALLKEYEVAPSEDLTKCFIIAIALYKKAVSGDMRAIDKIFEIQDEEMAKERAKENDTINLLKALNDTAVEVWK